ncbi:MAG: ABC transporter substrate-binding protein [Actinomycetota bacterium]
MRPIRISTAGTLVFAMLAVGCSDAATDAEPAPTTTVATDSTTTEPAADDQLDDVAAEPDAIEVVDGSGTTLRFDIAAERVACRNSGCSVTLAQLGIVPVASTFEPARAEHYWGAEAASITLMPEGAENYAALDPDLIVVGAGDPILSDLEVIAPVYVIAELGTIAEDAAKLTQDLATLTGSDERGQEIVAEWNRTVADITAAEVSGADDVRLLQLWAGDPAGFSGWTSNSQWCDLLRSLRLVGECVFDPALPGSDFTEFSTEAVLAAQPSHISYQLEWQYIGENVALENRADEAWLQLDAVQNGNAYRVPTSGNFTPSFFELIYELENYLFHVFGPDQGFEDPGNFVDWSGPEAAS